MEKPQPMTKMEPDGTFW